MTHVLCWTWVRIFFFSPKAWTRIFHCQGWFKFGTALASASLPKVTFPEQDTLCLEVNSRVFKKGYVRCRFPITSLCCSFALGCNEVETGCFESQYNVPSNTYGSLHGQTLLYPSDLHHQHIPIVGIWVELRVYWLLNLLDLNLKGREALSLWDRDGEMCFNSLWEPHPLLTFLRENWTYLFTQIFLICNYLQCNFFELLYCFQYF